MKDYLEKFSLRSKTAFITGGAGLIGSEVSKALAVSGARAVILDTNKPKAEALKEEIVKAGFSADYEYFDITDTKNLEKNIIALLEKYNSADVWVNAAYPKTEDWSASFENLDVDSWRRNIDMHLNGYFIISQKIAGHMKKQKQGSIINFASIYGIVGPNFSVYKDTKMTSPAAYSAIKGGIVSFSRYLASYLGPYNVRVNSICPGGVFDGQNEIFVKNYSQETPMKRMARPEEVASAVLFLASDASSYVTGTALMVDGGWTAI